MYFIKFLGDAYKFATLCTAGFYALNGNKVNFSREQFNDGLDSGKNLVKMSPYLSYRQKQNRYDFFDTVKIVSNLVGKLQGTSKGSE